MTSNNLSFGQGIPADAEGANGWRPDRWRPLLAADRDHFERKRSARFIVRRWIEDDDRTGCAKANQLDMVGATIVFRSGHRSADWDVPPRDSLRGVVELALWLLQRCPALGADAIESSDRDHSACEKVALDGALQLSINMIYVDAPGTFWIADDSLIVFRGFREETVEPFWRRYLLTRSDKIKRDFLDNDRARRRAAKLFRRVSSFRLFPSKRRAKR